MSPAEKLTPADTSASNGKRSVRSPWLLAAAIPLAGLGSAVMLSSGPDAEPAAVVQTNPLAINAPVEQLGSAAPEGSWQRGVVTQFSLVDQPEFPTLQIDATQIETGRYSYPGDLVIDGDLQTPGVEITAGSITVRGSINADFVSLETDYAAAIQRDHKMMTLSRVDRQGQNADRIFLVAFEQHYAQGDISVSGDITGDNIELMGGRIAIGGDANGDVSINGSAGEVARAVIKSEYYSTYTLPHTWREGVAPEAFNEQERNPVPVSDQPTVTIVGDTGADVQISQGHVPAPGAEAELAAVSTPGHRP